jgi:hypothetical protein
VQTLEDLGGRVGCNREESAEGWVEDVWVEIFVKVEAKGGVVADRDVSRLERYCKNVLLVCLTKVKPRRVRLTSSRCQL